MKRNLILLAICIIIAAIYFFDVEHQKKQDELEAQEKQLIHLDKDDIAEVTITKPDQTLKAVKADDRWKLLEPFETAADKNNWDTIVTQFTGGERQRVIEENAQDLEPFGLNNPTFKVTFAKENGEEAVTIHLGNETPTAGKYYALIEGASDVFSVLTGMHTALDKSLFDFRDKTVFSFTNAEVQKIEVQHSGMDATFERKSEDQWLVTEPIQVRADNTQITDLMNTVRNSRISLFIEEEPESYEGYGLVEAATRIVLWTQDEDGSGLAARALLIGATGATEDLYAMREGQKNVFTINPQDFNNVPKSIDEIRLKKVTPIRSWEVERFQVHSAGETILSASKDAGDWFLLAPEEGKANYSTVSTLIRDMTGLELDRFIEGEKQDLLNEIDLAFHLETDSASETLSLSGPQVIEGESFYLGAWEDPLEIYAIAADSVSAILERAKTVQPEPASLDENQ